MGIAQDVEVITTEGVSGMQQVAEKDGGKKVKRTVTSANPGKYKSLTYSATPAPTDEEVGDCKQQ